MRGAWGKPYGTVARVNIGQIILSIRCKDNNRAVVIEALRRARYKFPGRQKIIVSKKWGFTNVAKEEYMKLKEAKMVIQCVSLLSFIFSFLSCLLTLFMNAGMVLMSSSFAPVATSSRTSRCPSAHRCIHPYPMRFSVSTTLLLSCVMSE